MIIGERYRAIVFSYYLKNLKIIENGGWHFAFLQNPRNISKKIKSFSHGEFNTSDLTNEKEIEKVD